MYNVAKLELSDDSKLKLNILKEQEEMIEEENEREKDTVTKVKDKIKLDDYEETASEGIKIEADDPVEGKNGNETQRKKNCQVPRNPSKIKYRHPKNQLRRKKLRFKKMN